MYKKHCQVLANIICYGPYNVFKKIVPNKPVLLTELAVFEQIKNKKKEKGA